MSSPSVGFRLVLTSNCCYCSKFLDVAEDRFIIFPCEHAFHFKCFFKIAKSDNCILCDKNRAARVTRVVVQSRSSASASAVSNGVLSSSSSTQLLPIRSLKERVTENKNGVL